MNDVELDELLALDGARWREGEPRPSLALTAAVEQAALGLEAPRIVAGGAPRRSRRWLVAPLAASVVALAVAVHLVAAHRDQAPKPAVPLVPTIAVSYHGLTFNVPDSWKIERGSADLAWYPNCQVTPTNTVYVHDWAGALDPTLTTSMPMTAECFHHAPLSRPLIDVADLQPDPSAPLPRVADLVPNTQIAGLGALRTSASGPADSANVVVTIPHLQLGLTFLNMTDGDIAKILASARQSPTDGLGCQDDVTSIVPTRNLPSRSLVPATPSSGVVCQYLPPTSTGGAYRLVGSRRLEAAEVGRLVAWSSVAENVDQNNSAEVETPDQSTPFLYQFAYSDGSRRTIEARATTPTAEIFDGDQPFSLVARAAGFWYSFPTPFRMSPTN